MLLLRSLNQSKLIMWKCWRNDVGYKKYINKTMRRCCLIYYWPHINESKKCEACFCLLRWSVSSYARRSNTARVFRSNTYTHALAWEWSLVKMSKCVFFILVMFGACCWAHIPIWLRCPFPGGNLWNRQRTCPKSLEIFSSGSLIISSRNLKFQIIFIFPNLLLVHTALKSAAWLL